jgi:hypothetical protein
MPFGTRRRKAAPAEGVSASGQSGWRPFAFADGGQFLVREIGLRATRRGLGVVSTDGSTVRSWSWARVIDITVSDAVLQADGTTQMVKLHVEGGEHVFMCSSPELATLRSSLERNAPRLCAAFPIKDKRSLRKFAVVGSAFGVFVFSGSSSRRGIARHGRHLSSAPPPLPLRLLRDGLSETIATVRNWRDKSVRRRLVPLGAGISALALIGGGFVAGSSSHPGVPTVTRSQGDPRSSIMARMEHQYDSVSASSSTQSVSLPAAMSAPAPAPPSLAGAPPLKSHEVFGFAPYWTLPEASGFELNDLTTIAYFSVDVNPDGSIDRSGPGWSGYESQDLSGLISAAHAAGDRVVLTATCFDQGALDSLTSSASAASTLASSLLQLVQAKNLDGVNLDFEGQGPEDRQGLDHLVAQVSQTLSAADPHYQLTMDTYASSAADPNGFYDISGLAPYVDAFFVMGYDMDDPSTPSPTAALSGPGFNDFDALSQYTSIVTADKVILGVPYYGYDWPTSGPAEGDSATGSPTPVSYSQVVAGAHPVYWDPTTQTPWTSFQVGSQWHQTFFDNPTSLALKSDLAASYHIAGVGVWALGMDGNDPSMMAALTGDAPVVKDLEIGPSVPATGQQDSAPPSSTTTATTSLPASGGPGLSGGSSTGSATSSSTSTSTITVDRNYEYAGTWDDNVIELSLTPPGTEPLTSAQPVGQLTGFHTNDPAYSCLDSISTIPVYAEVGASGTYEIETDTPGDCAEGTWQFTGPPPSGASASTQGSPESTTSTSTTSTDATGATTPSSPRPRSAAIRTRTESSLRAERHPLHHRFLAARRTR